MRRAVRCVKFARETPAAGSPPPMRRNRAPSGAFARVSCEEALAEARPPGWTVGAMFANGPCPRPPAAKHREISSMKRLALLLLAAFAAGAVHAQKAAVLLPGSINDQSWNAVGYGVVTRLKSMGYDTAYSENVQPADYIEAMKDF